MQIQGRRPDQLIVVIDHNEELLRRVRSTFSSDVLVFANTEVTGLSGARNTGVRVATATWSLFSMTMPKQIPLGWRSSPPNISRIS